MLNVLRFPSPSSQKTNLVTLVPKLGRKELSKKPRRCGKSALPSSWEGAEESPSFAKAAMMGRSRELAAGFPNPEKLSPSTRCRKSQRAAHRGVSSTQLVENRMAVQFGNWFNIFKYIKINFYIRKEEASRGRVLYINIIKTQQKCPRPHSVPTALGPALPATDIFFFSLPQFCLYFHFWLVCLMPASCNVNHVSQKAHKQNKATSHSHPTFRPLA